MLREVNLIDHLPPFMQEFREMQHIMNAAGPEIQQLCDELERVKNNQFILSCDEQGIARYEKMLKITPSASDSLETRRFNVWMKYNDTKVYTDRALEEMLKSFCGPDGYKIISNYREYLLHMDVCLPVKNSYDSTYDMLKKIVPTNLVTTISNKLNEDAKGDLLTGSAASTVMMYEIPCNIVANKVVVELPMNTAVAGSIGATVTVQTI